METFDESIWEAPRQIKKTWYQAIGKPTEVNIDNNRKALHSLGYNGNPIMRAYPGGILDPRLFQEADAVVQQLNCVGTTAAGLAYH